MGKVYLIGVGPGDEDLLTLKAVSSMSRCTAILYDRLAGGNVLKHSKDGCKLIYVGKKPGSHSMTQDEINDLIVDLAKEGHTVGRIKGGDPYVFGRGGEEALRLVEENIPFEVVPGITSPISVLNYAGIPITHRGVAQSFHVYTGMSAKSLKIDWSSAARTDGTLVFMMGLGNLDDIISLLSEKGKDISTPCAVVMRGTTSKQRMVSGTMDNISARVKKAGLQSPCIIVIGEVVKFSEKLDWRSKLPLAGMNICVTRSKDQSESLSGKLRSLGAEVTEINSIVIEPTPEKLESCHDMIEEYDHLVFTSINGVNAFFSYLKDKKIDVRRIKGKLASIGPATTKAISERGLIVDIEAKEFVGESLFASLEKSIEKGNRILIPRAEISRPYLREKLEESGCIVDDIPVYKTKEGTNRFPEKFGDVDVVLYTSPSTVRNMVSIIGREELNKKISLAIGPITKKELDSQEMDCHVCSQYTTDSLVDRLLELRK